ncbi:MAG: IclR family transcriptional regulator [Micropruina sp.]|uniref:IclR family transcriptional regulator n=1 Tax=Micropruina sp. TaxID=2737536 RepID=UPI0039E58D04
MSQSVRRALDLLGRLAFGPASLDDLAQDAPVHKTTVMRLLQSLEEKNFVVRDSQRRYTLGPKFFELSALALEQRDIRTIARPHLQQLAARTGHTVHLAAFEGPEVVYLDKIESRQPVRMYSRIGLTAALHAAAVGKVLLAGLSQEQRASVVAGLTLRPLTPRTITDPARLLAELDATATQGWAVDLAEHEEFVHCAAVGVRDARGHIVAAASCSVPSVLLEGGRDIHDLLPDITTCAEAISADLGWVPVEIPVERTPS